MKSRAHAAVSLAVAVGALALTTPPIPAWAVVTIALGAGVGIDFDHFLIARWRTGDWRAVQRCLRDPTIVFVDQDAIFERGDVGSFPRLLSHAVIGGVAVPVLFRFDAYVGGLVAVALYAHVLADLVAGVRDTVAVRHEDLSEETRRAQD